MQCASLTSINVDIVTVANEKHVAVAYGSSAAEIHDVQHQQSALSGENIRLNAKKDISIAGGILSAKNDVELNAKDDVNLTAVKDLYSKESEVGKRGSSYYNHNKQVDEAVKGSTIAAKNDISIASGKDINIKGSNVASEAGKADLAAENNINIANETEYHERLHEEHNKVSGILSSKTTDIYDYSKQNTVVGSSIENSNSVYNAQEKHEFKRTGLSVSVGGGYVDVVNNAANSVKHAADVEDKRLGALVAVKGYKDADKAIKNIKGNGGGRVNENLSINVSVGTTKSKSESNSTTTVANASEVKAGGEVNVTSTKKDIDITGSNVEGKDVTLNAKENLNITASKNTNKTEQSSKSSSASVGASLELGKGPSYSISGSMSKGEVSANGTTFNESNVTANKDLSFASGKDTNIKGGKLSGEKVTGNVSGGLNIESKQDSNSYKENNKSAGASIGLGSNKAISGSASVGKIDSNYKSVTDQSGIYAGKEGFDIRVEANTDLKGGIISSTADADKNKLSTGTLTFEDIQNKADYKAGGAGIKVNKNNDVEYNEKGITPDIGVPASGEAESTTKATISKGAIEIRDKENQKQDITKLNRDTQNSLNKLGEIFDKNTIKEKQEFAGLFQKFAHDYIGGLTGKIGQDEKAALNTFVDGLISAWTNGNFLAGASGTALLESMQNELEKIKDPALKQIVAGMIGALAGEFVGGDAQAGASSAVSTEKYNWLAHEEQEKVALKLNNARTHEERVKIIEEAFSLSQANREKDPEHAEVMEKFLIEQLEKITKYDNGVGISFKVNKDLGLHNNLSAMKEFFGEYNTFKYLPEVFKESVKLEATLITGGAYAGVANINRIITYGDLGITFVSNLIDSHGINKEFIAKMGYEEGKTIVLSAVDKYTGKSKYVGVVALGKTVTSVYLDVNYKSLLTSKIVNKIDQIIDSFTESNINENYMGD